MKSIDRFFFSFLFSLNGLRIFSTGGQSKSLMYCILCVRNIEQGYIVFGGYIIRVDWQIESLLFGN